MSNGPTVQHLVTMADVWDAYRDDLLEVETYIQQSINSDAQLINIVAGQILSSGGKRIRPLLVILCARLCGSAPKESITLGSLIEFIHTATLLHDDVLDEADLRRGQKTARCVWGNQASILVGDYLYSQAMAQIAAFRNHSVNEVLAHACRRMAEGEVLQLCVNHQPQTTEVEYLQIVEYKTATLVAASCRVGAIIGGASLAEQEALYRFGLNLGMAFQLADDRLDYTADGSRFGKPLGQDLKHGMITLPLLHLLQHCTPQEGQWISQLIQSHAICDQDLAEIITLMHRYGSLAYASLRAQAYVDAAHFDLEPFSDGLAKRALAILANYMTNRDQ